MKNIFSSEVKWNKEYLKTYHTSGVESHMPQDLSYKWGGVARCLVKKDYRLKTRRTGDAACCPTKRCRAIDSAVHLGTDGSNWIWTHITEPFIAQLKSESLIAEMNSRINRSALALQDSARQHPQTGDAPIIWIISHDWGMILGSFTFSLFSAYHKFFVHI